MKINFNPGESAFKDNYSYKKSVIDKLKSDRNNSLTNLIFWFAIMLSALIPLAFVCFVFPRSLSTLVLHEMLKNGFNISVSCVLVISLLITILKGISHLDESGGNYIKKNEDLLQAKRDLEEELTRFVEKRTA